MKMYKDINMDVSMDMDLDVNTDVEMNVETDIVMDIDMGTLGIDISMDIPVPDRRSRDLEVVVVRHII
jgi:hypothetical protein